MRLALKLVEVFEFMEVRTMTNEISKKKMKILIATDGSEHSDAVIRTSCQKFINAESANIKIVSVFEQPMVAVAAAPYAVAVQFDTTLEEKLREQAAQTVAAAERKVRECFPELKEQLTTQVLRGGAAQAIVEEAEAWDADLIIVGSHGYGFWERMFLGSVSNAITHHAPCSVLIVRKPKNKNGKH